MNETRKGDCRSRDFPCENPPPGEYPAAKGASEKNGLRTRGLFVES